LPLTPFAPPAITGYWRDGLAEAISANLPWGWITYLSEFTQRALDLKLNLAFETFAGQNFSAA
jgi:hypothetical protein